jgi:hypothetical protein
MSLASTIKNAQSWRLFARSPEISSTLSIIKWWESRRIPYNLIVGGTGILTCVVGISIALVASRLTHRETLLPNPPLFAVIAAFVYGVVANVCYTLGWIAEVLARRIWGELASSFGQISFTLGVAFSMLLTMSPLGFLIGALLFQR